MVEKSKGVQSTAEAVGELLKNTSGVSNIKEGSSESKKVEVENQVKKLPARHEIDEKYKWDLSLIYKNEELWEQDFAKVKEMAKQISEYKGLLGKSPENLLMCLNHSDNLQSLFDKVFVYATFKNHEDTKNDKYSNMAGRVKSLDAEVSEAGAFILPELIAIPEETLKKYLSDSKDLKLYEKFIEMNLRTKEHILSARDEELLSKTMEMRGVPEEVFDALNDADIKFGTIKDENGNKVEVTKGRFVQLMESKDRRVRKATFKALYGSYDASRNTLAATLNANVKNNVIMSEVRNYNSPLEAALFDDNVSTSVYENLIKTVDKNLPALHRYVSTRKKALKVDELHMYDIYVPIVEETNRNISFEKALEIVKEALSPLGEGYIQDLQSLFDKRIIDVYENQGKKSGAYSWGSYLTEPYILLNYQGTLDGVFTTAHEAGHSMHSFYSNKNQPVVYSNYSIFVAEVASIVNELILTRHLLNKTTNKQEKANLINNYLDQFRMTIFRQTMFAEFEKVIHEKVQDGETLTANSLCEIYYDLNKKHFGEDMVVDKEIEMEWSRIPHFYESFYVYKYATGFAAATAISKKILSGDKEALDNYLNFLKSGGSDYPLELLKKAGVDLTTTKPIEEAIEVFEELMDEFEELILEEDNRQ